MTRAEKQQIEEQRAKWRADWYKRTKANTKKARAYKQRKAESKAAWQRANPQNNIDAVQRFRDRWGRWPAKADGGEPAKKAAKVTTARKAPRPKPPRKAAKVAARPPAASGKKRSIRSKVKSITSKATRSVAKKSSKPVRSKTKGKR